MTDLQPDHDNANRHTEHGMGLLEEHIRADGLGRSILIDRNDRVIAGNGVLESAVNAGLQRLIIVETTGNELVAVKRIDVDLDSQQGRRMAIADNAIARKNLDLDEAVIRRQAEAFEIDLDSIGLTEKDLEAMRQRMEGAAEDQPFEVPPPADGSGVRPGLSVVIMCEDRADQARIHAKLTAEGYELAPLEAPLKRKRKKTDTAGVE